MSNIICWLKRTQCENERQALWDIALGEVEKGYLEGPFDGLKDVQNHVGQPSVCVSRRFLLQQDSPVAPKQRHIDDYKDSGVNAAYHVLDKLALHDVDDVSHMCQCISYPGNSISFTLSSGEQLQGPLHRDFKGRVVWQGRCLCLERAYQQVPVLGSHLKFAVVAVCEPSSGQPRYFISSSLPFEAGASVFSFSRVSRSLLHIAMRIGRVIGGACSTMTHPSLNRS